jgi:O-antigen/teichoic acid export membrane protein
MLAFSTWSYGTRLIQLVVLQFDKILVARWLGPAAVTFYSVPFNFAQRVNSLAGPAITAVYPVAAAGQADRATFLPQYLAAARLVHVATAALAIAVLVWGERFLQAWVGVEMAERGAVTLQILTIGFWLVSVGSFDGSCVEGWNRPRSNFAVSAVAALAGPAAAGLTYALVGRDAAVVATGVAGYFVAAGLGQMVGWYRLSRYPLAFMLRRVGLPVVEMIGAGILLARLLDLIVAGRGATIAALFALVAALGVYGLWRSMSGVELRTLGLRVMSPFLKTA